MDEIDKDEDEEVLQPKTQTNHSPVVTSNLNTRIQALKGGGQPLPKSARSYFGPRFGHDFSKVRIHTDSHAFEAAQSVNAKAFTVGKDVVFGAGEYTPETREGKKLLGHELTHVVQQERLSGITQREIIQRLGNVSQRPAGLSCPLPPGTISAPDETIEFGNRVTTLSLLEQQKLANMVRNWWAAGGNDHIRVDGYASPPGTDAINWGLSCDRALAVSAELSNPSSGETGIPASFITVYAHGETDEFGSEENNRVVYLEIAGGGAPTPTPPTPTPPPRPAPSPTRRAACQRARHTECVMRLGGCSNTRPGGIPTEQEITSYNAECRSESGYTGADVTPSDGECRAVRALPSATDCQNARLEETHICGPDITRPLTDVLANVRTTYAGWSPASRRRQACDAITRIPIPFVTSGFIMAWDIRQLFLQNTGWLCRLPFHPPCGMPPATDCDDENSSDCGNSVEVQNKCFLAGTVNYALFGQICRLCNDEFSVLSENTMENLIIAWKALGLFLDSSGPPIAWARCGFRGFPGHLPVNENRAHCRGRCPVRYPGSSRFTWIWEPHRPR